MATINFFHGTNREITEIKKDGSFGSFLFFSIEGKNGTASGDIWYRVRVDEDDMIEATQIFYHEDAAKLDDLLSEMAARFDISKDDAAGIIEGRVSEWDMIDGCDGEISHLCQTYTARAAKILGFRGVYVTDETGTAAMIDMLGRENELVDVSDLEDIYE